MFTSGFLTGWYNTPDEAYGQGAEWVNSFNLDDILKALTKLAG